MRKVPELPELETIKSQLSPYLPIQISSIDFSKLAHKNILLNNNPQINLAKKVSITEIKRFGKMLIFILNNHQYFLSQLGMSGTWLVGEKIKKSKHAHIIIKGKNHLGKIELVYDDPRRFGHFYYLNQKELDQKLLPHGKDIDDKTLTVDDIKSAILKFPLRPLKATLLDQNLFPGMGNYLANEVCALAKILPTRICQDIKEKEFISIKKAIKEILHQSIKSGGTTFQGGYRDAFGEKGTGVNNLVVFYQKTCQMCMKTPITKIYLNQHGTYFCHLCQK